MKIGVNARFLALPHTGIGQYTKWLFLTLAEQNPSVQFILVTHKPVQIKTPSNLTIYTVREKFIGTPGMCKTYWEQYQIPLFLRHKKVDVMHFPYPCNPWRKIETPVIVTVHDTIPWTLKAYRQNLTTRLYQNQCRAALKHANHILVVSETTKKDILDCCGHSFNVKISVVHNAPAAIFFTREKLEKRQNILKKYGINADVPYFIYVGGYDERKNVKMPVETFLKFIAPRYRVNFVLVGGKSMDRPLYKSFDDLTKIKEGDRLMLSKGQLLFTGFVAEENLPALYQSSLFFVSLSKKEGCNLPLMEAMASQIPIVVSDIAVHREMADNRALFCQPFDENTLTSIFTKLLTNEKFYQQQKQKLTDYRFPYSWAVTANEVMKIYQQF